MAAMFLAKRGTINMYRATSLHRNYNNNTRSVADGVIPITISRYFSSHANKGSDKSKEEGMGTTTDGKAPNVTMSDAADSAKDGLKQAIDVATEESGDASKHKSADNDEGSEENVAVGADGTVKGQNQSSG
ncbi:hypothetical protein EUTSA_v10026558mg [Eutrema salsugineum]|uniref:Uncharacterized protein n=2 Tax=Eutrema salsugineum TaxID=72664 RepID=V4MNL0_EUTSA|nr:hypothetical protein EUTSA_v10026558mg [Eutrema salsugineum]